MERELRQDGMDTPYLAEGQPPTPFDSGVADSSGAAYARDSRRSACSMAPGDHNVHSVRARLDWRFPQVVLVETRAEETRARTGW